MLRAENRNLLFQTPQSVGGELNPVSVLWGSILSTDLELNFRGRHSLFPNSPVSFYVQSFFSLSQDGKCHPFPSPAIENLASSQPSGFSHGWPWQRFMVKYERASFLPRPWGTEDGMAFVLLSPHHRFQVGSHSDGDLEVTQVSCTPHFADGETDTYSRDMTGLGYIDWAVVGGELDLRRKPM